MANTQNVRIGACRLLLGGVDIGHTMGDVTFRVGRDLTQLNVSVYGSSAVDYALSGTSLEIECQLAEPLPGFVNVAVPEGTHQLGATGTPKPERVFFDGTAGYQLGQDAKELILHPVARAAGDTSEDVVIFRAVSTGDTVELGFSPNNQRVLGVTFSALIDETKPEGQRLGRIGSANLS